MMGLYWAYHKLYNGSCEVINRGLIWRDHLFFAIQSAICSLRPFYAESNLKDKQYTIKPTSSLKEKYFDTSLHLKIESKGKKQTKNNLREQFS